MTLFTNVSSGLFPMVTYLEIHKEKKIMNLVDEIAITFVRS